MNIIMSDATYSENSPSWYLIEKETNANIDNAPKYKEALEVLNYNDSYSAAIIEPSQAGINNPERRRDLIKLVEEINKKNIPLIICSVIKQAELEGRTGLVEGQHYQKEFYVYKQDLEGKLSKILNMLNQD